jgi:hypothetical protein
MPTKQDTITHSPIPAAIQKLLDEFHTIFEEPTTLPPPRKCDHIISLEKGAKVVNKRPYRIPHHQKNVMEKLVQELLLHNFIRYSTSPYSSPALIVKKKRLRLAIMH